MIISLPAVLTSDPYPCLTRHNSCLLPAPPVVHSGSPCVQAPAISLQQPPRADARSPTCCLPLLLLLISSKPCVPRVSHGKWSCSHINVVILFCCFILLSKSLHCLKLHAFSVGLFISLSFTGLWTPRRQKLVTVFDVPSAYRNHDRNFKYKWMNECHAWTLNRGL